VKPGRPEPQADYQFGDPTRRTYLAAERTLLAWWRTGLATVAVSLAIGRLLPAVARVPRTPYLWLGAGFGILALTLMLFGTLRQHAISRALDQGGFARLRQAVVLPVTAFMVALTVAAIVVLFAGD
jgi:inner membrane protein YidH